MEIKSITDEAFRKYGRVIDLEVPDLLKRLAETPVTDQFEYVASLPELEACAEAKTIQNSLYGGMPIQIGYCNGNNHVLNAVEYHRDSEINITLEGAVYIVGSQQDIEADYTYDTSKMEIFEAPAGAVIELYATTLHYAPCNALKQGFHVCIVLPKGTNEPLPDIVRKTGEDRLLAAKNKWLIAHEESGLGLTGAYVGLKGKNITV